MNLAALLLLIGFGVFGVVAPAVYGKVYNMSIHIREEMKQCDDDDVFLVLGGMEMHARLCSTLFNQALMSAGISHIAVYPAMVAKLDYNADGDMHDALAHISGDNEPRLAEDLQMRGAPPTRVVPISQWCRVGRRIPTQR